MSSQRTAWFTRNKVKKKNVTQPTTYLISYVYPASYPELFLTNGVNLGLIYSTERLSSRVQKTSSPYTTAKSRVTSPCPNHGVNNSMICSKWSLFDVCGLIRWCQLWPNMWLSNWGRHLFSPLPLTCVRATWTPTPPPLWCLCCLQELIPWLVRHTITMIYNQCFT